MGLHALTIEDSSIVRKILRERLKRAGWDVIEASTASEGWELFQSFRPQLVTLDIVMPSAEGLDALSLLERMRKVAPNTAVIIVSGSNSIDDREKFMQAGAMAFISKPFVDFEKVLHRLGRLFPALYAQGASEVRDLEPISERSSGGRKSIAQTAKKMVHEHHFHQRFDCSVCLSDHRLLLLQLQRRGSGQYI
jgi:two-component system chemotaxis response regulator CheY